MRGADRIRQRADFERVYAGGRRNHGRFMTVIVLPSGETPARFGVSASKKVGNAVLRNRVKRLSRELFRRSDTLRGVDVVVVPKTLMARAPFDRLEAEFRRCVTPNGSTQTPKPSSVRRHSTA